MIPHRNEGQSQKELAILNTDSLQGLSREMDGAKTAKQAKTLKTLVKS